MVRTPAARLLRLSLAGAALLLATTCESPSRPAPIDPASDIHPPSVGGGEHILVGAGDIGWCGSPGHDQTARLLDIIPGTVFTTGDNAYMSGTLAEFRNCYEPTWGRHRMRTRPAPGNHDYETPAAVAYYAYFGERAGPPGRGYYSYNLGSWHVISLNSLVPAGAGSAQLAWLQTELQVHHTPCAVAYWHDPLFSSGPNGNQSEMREVWRVLHKAGVDVVLAGDDHNYERFAPQDASGRLDMHRGIRQFVVGTGGAPLYTFASPQPNSEVRISTWGVLKLSLRDDDYQWEFIPVDRSGGDNGTARCH